MFRQAIADIIFLIRALKQLELCRGYQYIDTSMTTTKSKGTAILVTGATGTVGSELVKQLTFTIIFTFFRY
jgi:FlaA1/EpsC-like NDP-sugar epimerase